MRVAARELAAAVVIETPAAARRHRIRVDALQKGAIPIGAFAGECVVLPPEPAGRAFNAWLRSVVRAAGFELERTLETPSAAWDQRLLPVAAGDAVAAFVGDWEEDPIFGVVGVPFEPPLTLPIDLASSPSPTDEAEQLVRTARALRDAEGWLSRRPARTELPVD